MALETKLKPAASAQPHRSRRDDILAAALRLFSEFGVHTVTTRQIAAVVGISQPSLYAHFPTKQALAAEVCAKAFHDLASHMTSVFDALQQGRADLRDLAHVYVDFGLTEPDAYRLAFMIEEPDLAKQGEGNVMLTAGLHAFDIHRKAVALTLGQGLAPDALELLSQSLWASLHGLVSLLIARPEFPWADRQRLIDLHIEREFRQASSNRSERAEARPS
jgi:AcrR family transcriptional regulator